jgi:uncharacterized membrane protein
MSALDTLTSYVPPDTVRSALRQQPEYVINRNRAAAVVQTGFSYYDTYKKFQPAIFGGACVGAILSALALYKRRKIAPEAKILYTSSCLVCTAVAWFTRPDALRAGSGVPADAPAGTEKSTDSNLVTWVDQKVEQLSAENPNFADVTIKRLVSMPGIATQFKKMNPVIRAVIV